MKPSIKNEILNLLPSLVSWFMIWGTYNAVIYRLFEPEFPHNVLDLFHGIRTLLPFLAIFLSIIFLIRNKKIPESFFSTPLGLLSIYALIGIISSVFSVKPFEAFYWGILYSSAIIVLLAILSSSNPEKKIFYIIISNSIIAGVIALAMFVFFLMQPGVFNSITPNFLICNDRPFEDLGGITKEAQMFDMVGTRPTGLGRYSGIIAIVAFVGFLYSQNEKKRNKVVWLFLFFLFLFILFFSKGRTAIVGFLVAIIFTVLFSKKINLKLFLVIFFIFLVGISSVFLDIPCKNFIDMNNFQPKNNSNLIETQNLEFLDIKNNIFTLTGRTTGVWRDSWRLFTSSPLLGYGFQADRFFLEGQHAHNTLIQALIQTGLFGTIPLVIAFILTFFNLLFKFKNLNNEDKQNKYFLILIISLFIFFAVRTITESSGAFFSSDWLFLAPIVAYVSIKNS